MEKKRASRERRETNRLKDQQRQKHMKEMIEAQNNRKQRKNKTSMETEANSQEEEVKINDSFSKLPKEKQAGRIMELNIEKSDAKRRQQQLNFKDPSPNKGIQGQGLQIEQNQPNINQQQPQNQQLPNFQQQPQNQPLPNFNQQQPQNQQLPNFNQQQPQNQPLPNFQNNPRNANVLSSVDPKQFMMKIPNREIMRDFLYNKCGLYCPPQKDLTTPFIKKILSGDKRLLKLQTVQWVDQVPNWKEFTAKVVWEKCRNNRDISDYFPDYSSKQRPVRRYLLNVLNTVNKGSVVQGIKLIRDKRRKVVTDDAPIQMTSEFANLLSQFEPVSHNDKRGGLNNLREFPQCCLCLSQMRAQNGTEAFKCGRHKVHKRCYKAYMRSEPNPAYSCPMRCPAQ